MLYAQVITELSLDKAFDYAIPENMEKIAIGCRVEVPFGRTKKIGFVVNISENSNFPPEKIKKIYKLIDEESLIAKNLFELGNWISKYYCCSIEQAIKVLLPGVIRGDKVSKVGKQQYVIKLLNHEKVTENITFYEEKNPKYALVLKKLSQRGEELQSRIRHELKITDSIFKTMESLQLISREKMVIKEDVFIRDNIIHTEDLELSDEQKVALDETITAISQKKGEIILLNGVTGSGKTEVYLQAIRYCLENNLQAIVLVPEIALTPQTVERFRSRFGDKVSVLHSGLTDRERFDDWWRVYEDKVQIAVGARSALFSPFKKLGLIIVDEEHESTYKQGETPRYHARDVAVMRGKLEKCAVLLGSATPSFESLYNVKQKKYKEVLLTKRHGWQKMPEILIVNLKEENCNFEGTYSIFSKFLIEETYRALNQGEQVIFFLNRRGFSTSLQCEKCGFVLKCPHCDHAYTYHKKYGQIICHYCNDIFQVPKKCPECQDLDFLFKGLGTEKLEEIAGKLFPKAKIARMDSDNMSSEKDYRETLNRFKAGKIDILIGTQMIAKGLHFPNVTLVGILMADLGLHIPDFRAAERTLQLITQVAGRAGRGEIPGRVLVQTLTPYHAALQAAAKNQYVEFFETEFETRKMFFFPPSCHAILIHLSGQNTEKIVKVGQQIISQLQQIFGNDETTQIGELIVAPIEKIDKNYRYQILIRSDKIMKISMILRQAFIGKNLFPDIKITIDVDPVSLL